LPPAAKKRAMVRGVKPSVMRTSTGRVRKKCAFGIKRRARRRMEATTAMVTREEAR
jgi:hypothetical protein